MTRQTPHGVLSRTLARVLVASQLLAGVPVGAAPTPLSMPQPEPEGETPPPEAPVVSVNRQVPVVVQPQTQGPSFSSSPTTTEITASRMFGEPLVPVRGEPTTIENRALAAALTQYVAAGAGENFESLEGFLEGHATSVWRASLLTNLGVIYRHSGYYSRALQAWQEAWSLAKGATAPAERAVADKAVGELVELLSRLGRLDALKALTKEVEGREVGGSAGEKLAGTKQAIWLLENMPETSYRCGPLGLDRILAYGRTDYRRDPKIMAATSTKDGTSLAAMFDLANSLAMDMQMAQREDRDAAIPVPALIHWKAGHFAAIVKEEGGAYLVQDSTFVEELWVSRKALASEASGYALIKAGPLPPGWRAVDREEGGLIFGKGQTPASDAQKQTPCDKQSGGGGGCPGGKCKGMAQYSFHTMLVNLHIADNPVGYSPPRGPDVRFHLYYNQREVFQPQTPAYGNLGPKWTNDWLSFVEDDPANLSQPANVYLRGGGQETFTGFNSGTQSYATHYSVRATLVRTATSPVKYERRMADGSVDTYAQADGAVAYPRKVFLTRTTDPQGNYVAFTYDASLRLVALTDAIGQVTTLSYELPASPLKLTKVTDPFGRFARIEYNPSGQLMRITDVIGLTSDFVYGSGDFITSMTTAYGTTSFAGWEEGRVRWLEATDPMGAKERLEYQNTVDTGDETASFPYGLPTNQIPAGFSLNMNFWFRNTFFWDKRASALYPGEYTKAKLIHWEHTPGLTQTSGMIENEKNPLESNRTFYTYPGQPDLFTMGTHSTPNGVGKILDDGTSQIYRYEYNLSGKVCKSTDPLGRETRYTYGTSNVPDATCTTGSSLDLLKVEQKNGAVYDVLSTATYNAQHLPLTKTDASNQTTTFTYNTAGQLLTVVTPPRPA